MSAQDNHEIDNSQDGDKQDHGANISIVPAIVNEFGDDLHPDERARETSRDSSKDITLQRLSSHGSWEDIVFGESRMTEEANLAPAPSRRLSLVSIILVAAAIGALSGVGTTWGLGYFAKDDKAKTVAAASAAAERERTLNSAIAQVSSELQTVKANADAAAKASAAKIAKLGETIDKMKAAAAESKAATEAKASDAKPSTADVTGSIPAPAVAAPASAPSASQAPAFGRLPIVDGWTLREVANGGATIEGRMGVYEVYPGDPLPSVGRVNAIRRQDGRWVVVTERGLITSR